MYELKLSDLADLPRDEAEAAIRARVQIVPFGSDRLLARVLGRYKMFLETADTRFAPHVALDGYWESWLTLYLIRNVTSGMHIVDFGAGHGYYSCLLADAVGPGGKVDAVEQDARKAGLLRTTIELNGFSRTVEIRAAGSAAVPMLDELLPAPQRLDVVRIGRGIDEGQALSGMSGLMAKFRPGLIFHFNTNRHSDPERFLDQAVANRRIGAIGFDCERHPTSKADLMTRRRGEEWLVHVHD